MNQVDELLSRIPEASDPMIRAILKLYAFQGQTDMVAGMLESLLEGAENGDRAQVAEQVAVNVTGPSASLALTLPDARMTLDSVPLTPSRETLWPQEISGRADKSVRQIPSLAELQASDNVRPGTPHEAIARYERERLEYGEDVRAMLEMRNLWLDYLSRRVMLSAAVTVDSDDARPTRVRVTVPQGVGIELPHEELGIDKPALPLPMKAPLDQNRKRLVRRLVPVRAQDRPEIPVERYSMPDGSTVLVVGPGSAGRLAVMTFRFALTFASWESVKPVTLTYDIAPEGMPAASGSVSIGTHSAS
jgi:hypothetical protein